MGYPTFPLGVLDPGGPDDVKEALREVEELAHFRKRTRPNLAVETSGRKTGPNRLVEPVPLEDPLRLGPVCSVVFRLLKWCEVVRDRLRFARIGRTFYPRTSLFRTASNRLAISSNSLLSSSSEASCVAARRFAT